MPPLPDVPKVVRLTQKMTLENDLDILNRVYLQYGGSAPTVAELDTFCASAATGWATTLAPVANSEMTLIEMLAEDLTSPSAAVGVATVSHAGTRSGNVLSGGTATIVRFTIARRYRGGHPRSYWPGAVSSDLANADSWTTGWTTACTNAWTSWVNEQIAAGWSGAGTINQVSVSYYSGFTNVLYPSGRYHAVPTLRPTPIVDNVTAISCNPAPGSQRRRNLQP